MGSIHMKFSMKRKEKGDLLIQAIIWAGLTVHVFPVLSDTYICACPKPGLGFPTSYVMVFFVFSEFS